MSRASSLTRNHLALKWGTQNVSIKACIKEHKPGSTRRSKDFRTKSAKSLWRRSRNVLSARTCNRKRNSLLRQDSQVGVGGAARIRLSDQSTVKFGNGTNWSATATHQLPRVSLTRPCLWIKPTPWEKDRSKISTAIDSTLPVRSVPRRLPLTTSATTALKIEWTTISPRAFPTLMSQQ